MDWIERLFHIAPDAGNGKLELSIMIAGVLAVGMVVVSVAVQRYFRDRRTRSRLSSRAQLDRLDT